MDAQLWDTAGQEEFERIRVLGYENTNCFLLCFCVADMVSFDNLKKIWLGELRRHRPEAKILLVGTKCDLRKPKPKDANYRRRTTISPRSKSVRDAEVRSSTYFDHFYYHYITIYIILIIKCLDISV